jgi:hypothetical protein
MKRNYILLGILLITVFVIVYFTVSEAFTMNGNRGAELIGPPVQEPYSKDPINKLEDYDDPGVDYILTPGISQINPDETEADVVADQEGVYGKEASDMAKNARRNQRQFDYPQLPPISLTRQIEEAKNNIYKSQPAPLTTEGFADIEAKKMELPDYDKLEEEEKKILATYQPKNSKDLLKYSIEDSEELIKKIYDSKGLIPSYTQRPDGIWEVYETMEKNPKIVWEDEVQVERYAGQEVRKLAPVGSVEQTINVPTYANTLAAGLDPFFEPRTSLRPGRNDYTRWTPGLERMFAPTNDATTWY